MGFLDGYKTYDPKKEGYGNARSWRKALNDRFSAEEVEEILERTQMGPLELLELPQGQYTKSELKKAFYRALQKWHPDVCKNPDAEERTKAIIAAYQKLTS